MPISIKRTSSTMKRTLLTTTLAFSLGIAALLHWDGNTSSPTLQRPIDPAPRIERPADVAELLTRPDRARDDERASALGAGVPILVRDALTGEAVASARLEVSTESGTRQLTTGVTGQIRVPHEGGELRLLASAPGYGELARYEPQPDPATGVVLDLPPLLPLAGRVLTYDDAPLADLEVLAVRPEQIVEVQLVEDLEPLVESGHVLRTTSAADGAFRFDDLPGGVPWILCAGRNEVLTPEAVHGVPGGEEVTLRAGWVYSTTVRLRESGGETLRVDPTLYQDTTNPIRIIPENVGDVRSNNPALRHLGVTPADLDHRTTRFDKLVLLIGTEPLDEVGPIEVHAALPGYVTETREIMVPRWRRDSPDQVVVELAPVAEGWGDLTVVFDHATNGLERGATCSKPAARLSLQPVDGSKALTFVMDSMTDYSRTLRGVPAGAYRFSWTAGNGFRTTRRDTESMFQIVEIRPDEEAVLIPDTRHVGTATLELITPNGDSYEHGVRMVLRRLGKTPDHEDFAFVSFAGSPYRIEALPEGDYEVAVGRPTTRKEDVTLANFSIPPGGLIHEAVQLHR